MPFFTQEDLLLYIYKETSPTQSAAIEAAISLDWALREELENLQASVKQLDIAIESPRMEAVLNVLNYARETDTVETH